MPAASLVQASTLVSKHLLEHASVSAIASAVYTAYPRDADAASLPLPAVVLDRAGGETAHPAGVLQQAMWRVWTLSRVSQDEAATLHEAVISALAQELLFSNVLLAGGAKANPTRVLCQLDSAPADQWLAAMNLWATVTRWRITVSTLSS